MSNREGGRGAKVLEVLCFPQHERICLVLCYLLILRRSKSITGNWIHPQVSFQEFIKKIFFFEHQIVAIISACMELLLRKNSSRGAVLELGELFLLVCTSKKSQKKGTLDWVSVVFC